MDDLAGAELVAFDTEGVDLSREGPLTIITLKRVQMDAPTRAAPAFVIDVQDIGGVRALGPGSRLRRLLESSMVTKLTFDCRTDSDALWHQFGVSLTNVLDLQVLEQGVRIHRGAPAPRRNGTFLPYVSGLSKVSARYACPWRSCASSTSRRRTRPTRPCGVAVRCRTRRTRTPPMTRTSSTCCTASS